MGRGEKKEESQESSEIFKLTFGEFKWNFLVSMLAIRAGASERRSFKDISQEGFPTKTLGDDVRTVER